MEQYEGIRPGYHMNKRHWISVYFHADVTDGKIQDLVRQSYESVVAKMARKGRSLYLSGEPTLRETAEFPSASTPCPKNKNLRG